MDIPIIGIHPNEEQPTPITPEPTPGAAAFPGQVGAVTEQASMEAATIAQNQRMLTAQEQAVKAESDYLGYAMQARDRFSELRGLDALSVSEEVKEGLKTKLYEIRDSLRSRHARDSFMASSMRNWRIFESQINTHAGQQRVALDAGTYTNGIQEQAKFLAGYGATAGADLSRAHDVIEAKQMQAYQRAALLGYPEEAAHAFAAKTLAPMLDAWVGSLVGAGHPQAKEEFERWQEFMSPGKIQSVNMKLDVHQGKQIAADIVFNAPKLNFSRKGEPDKDGMPDENWVNDRLSKLSDEERRVAEPMVSKLMGEESKRFNLAVNARIGQIMADGHTVDGNFEMDREKSSDEITWMERNAPGGPGQKPGLRELEKLEGRDAKQAEAKADEEGLRMLRHDLIKTLESDPEGFRKLTPVDLDNQMLGDGILSSKGMRAGQQMLKGLQNSPKLQLLQSVPAHVQKGLLQIFQGQGDKDQRDLYEPELISELSEFIQQSGKEHIDDVAINQFIHHAFDRKAVPGKIWGEHWPNHPYLIELRKEARDKTGGGRLPVRILRDKATGELRVIYGTD